MPSANAPAKSHKVRPNHVLIATGGSGGHIFPGLAIAVELRRKGFTCSFIGYGKSFAPMVKEAGFDFIALPATQWNVPSLKVRIKALADLAQAFVLACKLIYKERPKAVVGMGGYGSVAAVLAARILFVPTAIHEQNVFPGKANRLLSRFAHKVLLAFDASRQYLPHVSAGKFAVVGNPLRDEVLALTGQPRAEGDTFNLLVFGGSQGTRLFADVVPDAIGRLNPSQRQHLVVTHQARPEDVERVRTAYRNIDVAATVEPFFTDLPKRLHAAHLVIGRAGTGTVTECAALNRASILVPLRLADGHQKYNAQVLANVKASLLMEENTFTVDAVSNTLRDLMTSRARLHEMEKNAALIARPQAAREAADEIAQLANPEPKTKPAPKERNLDVKLPFDPTD